MSDVVVKFPTARLEQNVVRHFNELIQKMSTMGLTPEQQMDLIVQSAKEIGCVEIEGVWQLPPASGDSP